ncbi:MAG: hypothetical protein BroJett030_30030 [Alphaproteobacteria bacterium]|nr:MAG: hypothetical protein BroJett030_30030 [Alphaproteobacteria bacterium]
MSGLTMFNRASEQALEWVRELQQEMKFPNEQSAYAALRAVLHTLRDCLTVQEAAELSSQMPTLIRGIYFEGWNPARTPQRLHNPEEFAQKVMQVIGKHPEVHAANATRAVFALLDRRISAGEIDDVISIMPKDLRPLWPREAVARAGGA